MTAARTNAPTLACVLAGMAVSAGSRQEAAGPNLPPVETFVTGEVDYPPAFTPESRTSRPVPILDPRMSLGKAPTPACDPIG